MPLIKVSLIEDDAGFADALARILNGTPGFRCLSTHATGEDALEDLPFAETDVVLVDLSLPGIGGAECIRRLRDRSDKTLFMVLTVHEDAAKIFESLKAGATGYVLKKTAPAQILEAIAELVSGGAPMSSAIARKVAQHFHTGGPGSGQIGDLTDREREILHQLSSGHSDKEIAEQMGNSIHTVRNHIKSIYAKLEVHSRSEATAKYLGR
jgi:DNA-binding NarL/FixJ family response regulator